MTQWNSNPGDRDAQRSIQSLPGPSHFLCGPVPLLKGSHTPSPASSRGAGGQLGREGPPGLAPASLGLIPSPRLMWRASRSCWGHLGHPHTPRARGWLPLLSPAGKPTPQGPGCICLSLPPGQQNPAQQAFRGVCGRKRPGLPPGATSGITKLLPTQRPRLRPPPSTPELWINSLINPQSSRRPSPSAHQEKAGGNRSSLGA